MPLNVNYRIYMRSFAILFTLSRAVANPIFPLKLQFLKYKRMQRNVQHCKQINNNTNSTNKLGYMLSEQEWRNVYKIPFQCLKDPTLLWFQYRIQHRIITTNTFLYKIKYTENQISANSAFTARTI